MHSKRLGRSRIDMIDITPLRFVKRCVGIGMCAKCDAKPLHLRNQIISIREGLEPIEGHVLKISHIQFMMYELSVRIVHWGYQERMKRMLPAILVNHKCLLAA